MKRSRPVAAGVAALALLATAILLLRELGEVVGGPPHPTEKMDGSPPEPAVYRQARSPEWSDGEMEDADLAGTVGDSCGRLLADVAVLVRAPEGRGPPLARTLTGPTGRFALNVPGEPPFLVHLEGDPAAGSTVARLPRRDLELVARSDPPGRGELAIRLRLPARTESERAEITIRDDLGTEVCRFVRALSGSPYSVRDLEHGAYDITAVVDDLAGSITGFAHGPDTPVAEVVLEASARVRARLAREARVLLIATTATLTPLGRSVRLSHAEIGWVRATVRDLGGVKAVDLDRLPAGEYLLRVVTPGAEIVDLPLSLRAGETRDLGYLDPPPATAELSLAITDRDGPLEFGYLLGISTPLGISFERRVEAGSAGTVRIEGLPAGLWFIRVGRMLRGPAHTRSVGGSLVVELGPGEKKRVDVDCTWRIE